MAPYLAWAAGAMLADLRPKLGQPGVPLTEPDLAPLAAWAAARLGEVGRTGG
jgi:hypothetical protein